MVILVLNYKVRVDSREIKRNYKYIFKYTLVRTSLTIVQKLTCKSLIICIKCQVSTHLILQKT